MKQLICLVLAAAWLLSAPTAGMDTARAPSFADFRDLEWTFSSGAGAWQTSLWIMEDGTFTGQFHDSEMGEDGEDYPYGTVYGCLFHGIMTLGEQVDSYTWTIHVEEVELDEGQAPEFIEDGIRYVTSDPYGVTAGHDMLLYLPGAPVDSLPEEFRFWAHVDFYPEPVERLPFYGLFDPEDDTGFIVEAMYAQ